MDIKIRLGCSPLSTVGEIVGSSSMESLTVASEDHAILFSTKRNQEETLSFGLCPNRQDYEGRDS